MGKGGVFRARKAMQKQGVIGWEVRGFPVRLQVLFSRLKVKLSVGLWVLGFLDNEVFGKCMLT